MTTKNFDVADDKNPVLGVMATLGVTAEKDAAEKDADTVDADNSETTKSSKTTTPEQPEESTSEEKSADNNTQHKTPVAEETKKTVSFRIKPSNAKRLHRLAVEKKSPELKNMSTIIDTLIEQHLHEYE